MTDNITESLDTIKQALKDDVTFLLSFAPATSPDAVESGLMGVFYVTGSYEGDVQLATRIQTIAERYEIDVNSIEDIEDYEEG